MLLVWIGFYYCGGLSEIIVDENNPNYASIDGVLFNKDKTILKFCPEGKKGEYTVPSGTENIDSGAFSRSHLSTIIISNSVIGIGESAFLQCAINSLELPNSVTKIGVGAFESCAITSITIPESITNIEDSLFWDCRKLKSITIEGTITKLGENVFEYVPETCEITYQGEKYSPSEFEALFQE